MKKLIVYLLLIFGAVIMLGPFVWMVLTSFKAPSEVQQWPPKFYTKNFSFSRDVKVVLKPGVQKVSRGVSLREAYALKVKEENLLTITVNDDPFYRGTMTIPLKGARYTTKVDEERVREIASKAPFELSWNTPEEFFRAVLHSLQKRCESILSEGNLDKRDFEYDRELAENDLST